MGLGEDALGIAAPTLYYGVWGTFPMWLTVCVLTIALAIGFAAAAIALE